MNKREDNKKRRSNVDGYALQMGLWGKQTAHTEKQMKQTRHTEKKAPVYRVQSKVSDESAQRRDMLIYYRSLKALIIKISVIVILLIVGFLYVFGVSVQKGEGMYPRLRDGDILLYYRMQDEFNTGDIVLFVKDGMQYTARVVASGGDVVSTTDDGKLMVNGSIQYEEIHYDTYTQGSPLTFPFIVPQDSYFLLGDMRTGAIDSRDFGALTEDEIEGLLIAFLRRRGM